MTITTMALIKMSQAELDELYKSSPAGIVPDGRGKGTAIVAAGSVWGKLCAFMIRLIVWQENIFEREQEFLINKFSPFRLKSIKAQVYKGDSWFCDGESIVLDYSKTSFVAQKIRDEIREVAPGIYLGQALWGKRRILSFILEF